MRRIKQIHEQGNVINPQALDMLATDILFWIENKGAKEAGESIGEELRNLLSELRMDMDINDQESIRFKNGLKKSL